MPVSAENTYPAVAPTPPHPLRTNRTPKKSLMELAVMSAIKMFVMYIMLIRKFLSVRFIPVKRRRSIASIM